MNGMRSARQEIATTDVQVAMRNSICLQTALRIGTRE